MLPPRLLEIKMRFQTSHIFLKSIKIWPRYHSRKLMRFFFLDSTVHYALEQVRYEKCRLIKHLWQRLALLSIRFSASDQDIFSLQTHTS